MNKVKIDAFIGKAMNIPGVSGYESAVAAFFKDEFQCLCNDIRIDNLGNLIMKKKGDNTGKKPIKIMLAAHMDEIGLMVKKIEENGFLRIASVGGVDQRTLLYQPVTVHGRQMIPGVIGTGVTINQDSKKNVVVEMKDMFIDTGLDNHEVNNLVRIGDIITIDREIINLQNGYLAGKALDDRAGVAVLKVCLNELQKLRHKADVYAVATVQEEVGYRGAMVSSYGIVPHIGIAIDVCHGDTPGVSEEYCAKMDNGPALGWGPHVHPKVYNRLKKTAHDQGISVQLKPNSSPRGTDTWALQICQAGAASALISLPLRYMHTSVEVLSGGDVMKAGRLIARFISDLDEDFVEELTCY